MQCTIVMVILFVVSNRMLIVMNLCDCIVQAKESQDIERWHIISKILLNLTKICYSLPFMPVHNACVYKYEVYKIDSSF